MVELNNLPDTTTDINADFRLYHDSTAEVLVETLPNSNELALKMYITDHDKFNTIIPDEQHNCEKQTEPADPSTVTDLPNTYETIFKAATNAVKEQYNLSRKHTATGLGVCTTCLPNPNTAGTLVFTEYFEP